MGVIPDPGSDIPDTLPDITGHYRTFRTLFLDMIGQHRRTHSGQDRTLSGQDRTRFGHALTCPVSNRTLRTLRTQQFYWSIG